MQEEVGGGGALTPARLLGGKSRQQLYVRENVSSSQNGRISCTDKAQRQETKLNAQ